MSFQVFASGAGGFVFEPKNSWVDGDDFEMMKTVQSLSTMSPNRMGAVSAAADKFVPSAGIADLVAAVANIELLHLLCDQVDLLAATAGDGGSISVFARKPHRLWADTSAFKIYSFDSDDSPGREFVKKIGPCLKATDLDNYGTAAALVRVISDYSQWIDGKSLKTMLNITLTKN